MISLVKTFFQKLFQVAYKLEEISIFWILNAIFIVIDVEYKRKKINHIFLWVPSTIQVRALSTISTNPDSFPIQLVYANIDYLICRIASHIEDNYFVSILWYIWKKTMKKFKIIDKDPIIYNWQKYKRFYGVRHSWQWCTILPKQQPIKWGWGNTKNTMMSEMMVLYGWFSGLGWYSTVEGLMRQETQQASSHTYMQKLNFSFW